jgi:hypothetical protein
VFIGHVPRASKTAAQVRFRSEIDHPPLSAIRHILLPGFRKSKVRVAVRIAGPKINMDQHGEPWSRYRDRATKSEPYSYACRNLDCAAVADKLGYGVTWSKKIVGRAIRKLRVCLTAPSSVTVR